MNIAKPHERGLSDENMEAYYEGAKAAVEAMRSDDLFYALDLTPGQDAVVQSAADYVEGKHA